LRAARGKHVDTLALTANDGGAVKDLATHTIIVPTTRTDRAQEIHLCIQHAICDAVESAL
jgi:D-sedoheptulose 7-phosphate isomerase